MFHIANLYGPVAADIEESARIFRDELASDQGFIHDLCRHVDQFHGKRLRPALLLLTAHATGAVRPAHHVLAAVVEMVHIATLVHDDVLDEADIRRRAATVNRLWGNERSVLLGDLLFSHAYRLCSTLDSQLASLTVAQVAITVCEGELMQVANRGNLELSESEYLDIISRKTASLIGACGQLGAHYAGADENLTRRMRHCCEALGVAFQITDDMLDLTGDEAEAGKSLGRDVEKGKLTLPLIHYLRTADAAAQREMLAMLREDASDRSPRIAARLADSSSIEYAQQAADAHVAQALEILGSLPPGDARDSLRAMAEFVLARRY